MQSYEERKAIAATAEAAQVAAARAVDVAATTRDSTSANRDFSFPVELPGSPPMTISWSQGEPAEVVAARFVSENGLGEQHIPDVVQFVNGAMAMTPGAMAQTQQAAAASRRETWDYEFPVELSLGGSLTIGWNQGEQPTSIADRFLAQHGLGEDNRADIVDFVVQAQTALNSPSQGAAVTEPSAEVQSAAVAQLCAMGFDDQTVRAALRQAQWSVDAAAELLLQ